MLMSVSIPWFFYALGIAFRESSFANAIGYTIPFVFLEISIYLLVNGMVDGRFGVVLALAVCGLIVAIGGVGTYIFTSTWFRAPFLAPVWTALGTIGFLLMVPGGGLRVASPVRCLKFGGFRGWVRLLP